jgi:cellobiose phosphorylase
MAFARMGQVERAWELVRMINPVGHADSPQKCARYKAEPYVVTADIYAVAPHVGRGGWSWYTGSAGWMYRLIVESLLGIERTGARLALSPQLPQGWEGFRLHYRFRSAEYAIQVRVAERDALVVDGKPQEGRVIDLVDDGARHVVELQVARRHVTAIPAARAEIEQKTVP